MADKQAEEQRRLDPETAPDPDEDDLSDLDDMLDEFSASKVSDSKPAAPSTSAAPAVPTASVSGPSKPVAKDIPEDEDDFTKQLQAGMASLLGQLDSNPDMQKEFEDMMKQLGAAAEADTASAAAASTTTPSAAPSQPTPPQPATSSSKKPAESSFQDTIRKTMERMQNSGDTVAAAATGSSEEDMLAQMLKEMESGNFGGESEEDLNKMLMGMMERLTNKDILYEPMKELHDKFPAWLRDNKSGLSQDDLARYEEQQKVVAEIVARFDRPQYSDDSNADREYIVERMQKMQAAGSPPPDLVGDMSAAQDALGDMEAGCPQQ
ncbi:Pex19 protein family-domain-containing protein [Delphinella strobiligena]|nr:Pex19 protein family-domain-containing protein [Delphinella strobiligena]